MRRPSSPLIPLSIVDSYRPVSHRRTFLSSGPSNPQILHARRTLPYSPATLFKVIASVDSYPTFLPFILSSRITARDKNQWPSLASLEVGYAGVKETFTSRVRCDPQDMVVEATSGEAELGEADEGLFEILRTKWELKPLGNQETDVDLQIEVGFKSAIYGAMMQAAAPGVAGLVVKAFEKRVEEVVKSEGGN